MGYRTPWDSVARKPVIAHGECRVGRKNTYQLPPELQRVEITYAVESLKLEAIQLGEKVNKMAGFKQAENHDFKKLIVIVVKALQELEKLSNLK